MTPDLLKLAAEMRKRAAAQREISGRASGSEVRYSMALDYEADSLDRFATELERIAQADRWQPISEAPKDGTPVLLRNDGGVYVGHYQAVYQSGYRPDNPWHTLMLNHDHLPRDTRYSRPTHWMPLPPPPTDCGTPMPETPVAWKVKAKLGTVSRMEPPAGEGEKG